MAASTPRILVAEAHLFVRDSIQQVIKRELPSAEVTVAATTEDAVQEASKSPFDAYIVSGRFFQAGLPEQIRKRDANARVYVLSVDSTTVEIARSAGFAAYSKSERGVVTTISRQIVSDLESRL